MSALAGAAHRAAAETKKGAPQVPWTLAYVAANMLTPEIAKYFARCALPAGATLAYQMADGKSYSFPGLVGLAPEWAKSACDQACQEKVSSCLASFQNRTGKHVNVQLVTAAASMVKQVGADGDDRIYPYQEGAFFGNYWENTIYACQGSDVDVGSQVKRFCAAEPGSCNTIFKDAGPCASACSISCTDGPGGRKVCSAVSCRDPSGRVWTSPMTVFLRNKIEPANADRLQSVVAEGDDLVKMAPGSEATFRFVDFGAQSRRKRTFVATVKEMTPGARLEVWVDGKIKLGSVKTPAEKNEAREVSLPLVPARLEGRHDVTLRVTGQGQVGRLAAIEVR